MCIVTVAGLATTEKKAAPQLPAETPPADAPAAGAP
jgi:hypothetical protein